MEKTILCHVVNVCGLEASLAMVVKRLGITKKDKKTALICKELSRHVEDIAIYR